jgi:subtilisin family serine protease
MAKKTRISKLFAWVITGFGILVGLAGTVGLTADTPDAATLSQDWKLNAAIIMQHSQDYDEKSILVKFDPGVGKAARKALAQSIDGSYVDRNDDGIDDRFNHIAEGRWAEINLGQTRNAYTISSVLMVFDNQPGIAYVQLNTKVRVAKIPNDQLYSKQWAMTKIRAPEAWEKTTGSRNVVVGVMDSGVWYTHPDLKANMWKNPKEIAGNGKDDDNNGYVDDVYGISAFNDSGDPSDPIMWQHGTHVAGIIGAAGNNRFAVAGVNWKVSIMALRFFDNADRLPMPTRPSA